MIQRRTQSLPADTQCINFMQLLFFHSSAVTPHNTKGTKSPTDSKSRNNSALPRRMKISACTALTQSPLRTDRNRRRQQSASMCTVGAMWPNLDAPAAEKSSALPSLHQPSATLSSLPSIPIFPGLTGAADEHRDIWGQHRVIRGALPEEPPRFLVHRAGAGDTQFPSSHFGRLPLQIPLLPSAA